MAGRGRGKPTMSFATEQLGFSKGEVPAPVLQPPPSYPPLERKPLPIIESNEMNYLVELKRDFAEYMRESPNYIQPIAQKKDIERYSDRYQDAVADTSESKLNYDWSRLPAELKLSEKRKKTQGVKKQVKKRKTVDVESKLAELEKKERMQQTGVEEVREEEEDEDEKELKDDEEEEERIDGEMDDETDYTNIPINDEDDDSGDDLDEGPTF